MSRPKDRSTAAGGGAAAEPAHGAPPGPPNESREERGDAASSRREPPHLTENDENTSPQDRPTRAKGAPSLPANAHGRDKVSAEEAAEPIDEESMYDRRPEEDKDAPPTAPKGKQ